MEENGSPEPQFDYDEGRTYFRVTLPSHPRYNVIHALRESALLWSAGERQAALSHLKRVVEAQPGSGALASRLIDYLAANDDMTAAEQILEQFVSHPAKTETSQPYLTFAKALLDRHQPAKARQFMDSIPFSGLAEDVLETAILRKRSKDYGTADALFSQIYSEMLDDTRFLEEFAQNKISLSRSLGNRNFRTKRQLNKDAVDLLRRTIQLTNDAKKEAWCWFELAKTLRWLGASNTDVDQAFLNATELRPEEQSFKDEYEQWKGRSR